MSFGVGNVGISNRLKEIRDRIVANRRLPQTGQIRRGPTEKMNDAYVDVYNPNVSPPFHVTWPKGNELGDGGWYDAESILSFWPEVVPDPKG